MTIADAPTVFPRPLPAANILIVDDSSVELELLREHLWANGLKVRFAHDGAEGLAQAQALHPDLILLDVVMPGIDGFETCRLLKSTDDTRDIPVIFMTALDGSANKLHGFSVGAVDYITKPVDPAEMLARISAHLALRAAHRALAEEVQARRATEQELRERTAQVQSALDRILQGERLLVSEKLAAAGQLTAGIAHEINNPVNYAMLAARQLATELDAFHQFLIDLAGAEAEPEILAAIDARIGQLRANNNTVIEGGERVLAIVRDLRMFARVDGGDGPTRLWPGLQSTLNLVRSQYKHDIRFDIDLVDDPELICNAGRLNQVFMNLLVNACQSVQQRSAAEPALAGVVSTRMIVRDNEMVVSFIDNGTGMNAATRARLFEPFFTTKPAGQGTGLGLAVSQGIIRDHGGHIEVDSTPGVGSEFRVVLPLRVE